MQHDVLLKGGRVFDGKGSASFIGDVAITGDRVVAVGKSLESSQSARVIDCAGRWVVPGFIDMHTHYDAEILVAPGLDESTRHGVTTVLLGSCSLSLAVGDPDDLADLFCRVEAVPDEVVRPILRARKSWSTHAEYMDALGSLALGPNVCSFAGHSAIRAHVMGMERSLTLGVVPEPREVREMAAMLEGALDAGYLGLSVQRLPWDKVGGDRPMRSRPLPSVFARWSEFRALTPMLRERDRIFQAVPNVASPASVVWFFVESAGIVRKRLRTTLISLMDLRAARWTRAISTFLSRTFNVFFDADFRWQALPEPFDLWADGIDLVVFEEFGAGAAALHHREHQKRVELFGKPEYRREFKREWRDRFKPRAFHRDLAESAILACPNEPELVGKTFADVARELGRDPVDTFLDKVAEHGTSLRWYTVMGNDRPATLEAMVSHPDVLIGFSDAGAHLRQMAHYNFPLRMLRLVRDAEARGEGFMTVERAVHRLTGEIASWLGIDAGTLEAGKRADVVVIDPSGLDDELDRAAQAPMEFFESYVRMVRRNDAAVDLVMIGGREAFARGRAAAALAKETLGRVLRAVR